MRADLLPSARLSPYARTALSSPSLPLLLPQAKLQRYHTLLQSGRSINAELRKSKGYRNPDFLQKIVEFFGIREHGSCYPPELFDPDGLPKEDYYDAITATQRALTESREAERKQVPRNAIDFRAGALQPGTGAAAAAASQTAARAPLPASQGRGSRWGA